MANAEPNCRSVLAIPAHFGQSALVSDENAAVIVRPWYRQFYLRRGDADWSSDQVSEDGYTRGLEVIDGFVYVGTTMYGSPTEVVIDLHVSDPGLDPSADRHSDALLDGDGNLDVLNWEPGEPPVATVPLPAGQLRLRASWFGTAAAAEHPDAEFSGEDLSPERITFDLWPVA